ncbi:hypothetical protein JOM56_000399 [Amanita muscaria]
MVLTFSTVAKLFLKLRRYSIPEPSEDSSSDEVSPSSQAPPPSSSTVPSTIPSSTPPVHNPSNTTNTPPAPTASTNTTPSTPKQKRASKRFSQGTPMSHSKSYTPGSPSSPSSPSPLHYRSSSEPASPTSPLSPTKQKAQRTETTSGKEPLTHPGLAETACERREPVERTDTYLCAGGVSALILLRMTRAELMDTASLLGANVLVEEQWRCTIYGPKSKATYKVQIHYRAYGTRSTIPDPHQPVAVDQTHSIPGLMTILRRNDD